jgi:GT2 family glycosyltransferase
MLSPMRPNVDVVIPFAGSPAALQALLARLGSLERTRGDTVVVVDNRARPKELVAVPAGVEVLPAAERGGSYYARNRGAARGQAPWLLFVDADVEPPPDLLDRYFASPAGERVGVLAGAVEDEPPDQSETSAAVRYAWLKSAMSQETTLAHGRWAFAQTANCAVRREAFEAVGGFREQVRSGGDADLCYRLAAAGWQLERRPGASVRHRNRATVPAMLRQRARHGAGAAWLNREHPGSFPRRGWLGLGWWAVRRAAAGMRALASGDRDSAVLGLLDGPAVWAFELGRLMPNRPNPRGGIRTLLPSRR